MAVRYDRMGVVMLLLLLILAKNTNAMDKVLEKATLGGGCFWCTEAVFTQLRGVVSAIPGYSGGHVKNPAYREVCAGTTGHAEVVQITFDPAVISFRQLLEVFFSVHDPTTLNRQGADTGTQYRSVVFCHSEAQKQEAEKMILELENEKAFTNRVVTEVAPYVAFYPAEDYHRDYFARNGNQPYCRMVVAPKVEKFRSHFGDLIKNNTPE